MSGTKYSKYFPKVEANRKNFEYLIDCIKKSSDYDDKIRLANYALRYATYHNTGYFISSFLENFYTGFAQKLDLNSYDIKYIPNSFLHVMTRGYKRGGHTRVVERWIDNAPKNQIHSVIFTTPNNEDMSPLENLTGEKNGKCIYMNTSWRLNERALKLRQIGMEYEYIVLHTHMEDPIATIAFGTEKFTRPVIFYNHASHMFWLGKNISDIVLDIIKDDDITKRLKGIQSTFPTGIPSSDITISNCDKAEARKKLGLPQNKKIIVSSGNKYKYTPICNDNFYDIFSKIIDEDTFCYIIGLDKNECEYIYEKSNKHIIPLGYINFNDGYSDYLKAADLYLDSYPLCSATAAIDAISAGTPVLTLKSVYPPLDYLTGTSSYCLNEEDFISKAKNILSDKYFAAAQLKELQESLIRYQSKKAWNENVKEMLKHVPSKHHVKLSDENNQINEINDLAVFINAGQDNSFLNDCPVEMFNEETIKKILIAPPAAVKLSILAYFYNSENCVKECIENMLNQTLEGIEIIAADDCSADKTLQILEKYASENNNIKLIKQNKHMGKTALMNTALDFVRGQYVIFCDTKNPFKTDTCKTAYNQIHGTDNNYFNFKNNKKETGNTINENYIYKREFLNINNIRYSDNFYTRRK